MILRALYELAQDDGLSASYEPLEVHYLVHLGPEGRYLGYTAPRVEQLPDGRTRRTREPRPPRRLVPRRSSRTSGDDAEFLVDKAEYVFGLDPESRRSEAKVHNRRELFRGLVDEALADPALSDNAGLRAVQAFLKRDTPTDIEKLLRPEAPAERKRLAGAWFAFVYEPDGGASCVHDHFDVRAYFERRAASSNVGGAGQCLVTGKRGVPLARLHASPKGIPPRAVTKGGVPLTSVNQESFKSYGLDEVGCAPIATDVSVLIDAALTRLLDDGYLGPDGQPMPARHLPLSRDTAFVYWARGGAVVDFVAGIETGDPEQVRQLLRAPQLGRPSAVDDPAAFYGLVLSGTQGRGIVRSFLESTVRDVARSVGRHFEDAAIARPFNRPPGAYPLVELRTALAALGDLDRLPPALAAAMYWSALLGRGYPRALFEAAVRRNRVEPLSKSGEGARWVERFAARCSAIKAYLNRNLGKEISVSLDSQRPDPAYRLGRLLAALEKVQQDALGDVNATLVDRYYGSASATPAAVFPTLVRRAQHHLGKLRRDKPGLSVSRERLIQEIVADLAGYPRTLSLEDQGLFSLGFYHQRQDMFTKKIKEDA
jgi:CRISPR-associated protein Csd1